jgi:hypothetical protein
LPDDFMSTPPSTVRVDGCPAKVTSVENYNGEPGMYDLFETHWRSKTVKAIARDWKISSR